jgi:hypothetical protein
MEQGYDRGMRGYVQGFKVIIPLDGPLPSANLGAKVPHPLSLEIIDP